MGNDIYLYYIFKTINQLNTQNSDRTSVVIFNILYSLLFFEKVWCFAKSRKSHVENRDAQIKLRRFSHKKTLQKQIGFFFRVLKLL